MTTDQSCFIAKTADQQRWEIYNALSNIVAVSPQVVTAPAGGNPSDLSMFPGGTVPGTGLFIAVDDLNIYTIRAGDTEWFVTPR